MTWLRRGLNGLPLPVLVVLCLTLGLAPFVPEPHLLEKLRLLWTGTLERPVDIADLALHALPWLLLCAKLALRG